MPDAAKSPALNPLAGHRPPLRGSISPLDRLIEHSDSALRTLFGVTPAARLSPAGSIPETVTDAAERRAAAALMRVNHAGEIAAQALYQGQGLTAKTPETRGSMQQAAQEEADHLAWCAARIEELGGRTSLLNPLWYFGSLAIGALAGLAGDRRSLGFLAETEQQVVRHLESHLTRLPPNDARSRAIVQQMQRDEAQHRDMAKDAGGHSLPAPMIRAMQALSKVMTRSAYRI